MLSDGENSLTVDASGVTTIDALASAITSHADHAGLDFTVSKTTAVAGVAAAFTVAGLTDANVETISGGGTDIAISDGTTILTMTGAEVDAIDGDNTDTATRARVAVSVLSPSMASTSAPVIVRIVVPSLIAISVPPPEIVSTLASVNPATVKAAATPATAVVLETVKSRPAWSA